MNDVLLYIRNFAYSHDSANVSAADRAKQYKKSEVFEDGGCHVRGTSLVVT